MAERIEFTIYEAALLLEGYLDILNRGMARNVVISRVSNDLRKMAQNNGIAIDSTYRNVNGISFQMDSMQSAFEGETRFKPASKLFTEIVALYMYNRTRFESLLAEAKSMIDNKNEAPNKTIVWTAPEKNRASFYDWMIEKGYKEATAQTQSSTISSAGRNAVIQGLTSHHIFETTDSDVAKELRDLILKAKGNGDVRFQPALDKYVLFCEEISPQSVPSEDNNTVQSYTSTAAEDSTASAKSESNKAAFIKWMLEEGYKSTTAQTQCSSVSAAGRNAMNHGLVSYHIFETTDPDVAEELSEQILKAPENSGDRFTSALKKYVAFCNTMEVPEPVEREISIVDFNTDEIKAYLDINNVVYTNPMEGYIFINDDRSHDGLKVIIRKIKSDPGVASVSSFQGKLRIRISKTEKTNFTVTPKAYKMAVNSTETAQEINLQKAENEPKVILSQPAVEEPKASAPALTEEAPKEAAKAETAEAPKAEVESQSVEKQFYEWLSQQVSPMQLSDLYMCFPEIEKFCLKIKVLRKPLFETQDIDTIRKVQKAVTGDRIFLLAHKKQNAKIANAIQKYLAFLKEYEPTHVQSKVPEKVISAEPVAIAAQPEKPAKISAVENAEPENITQGADTELIVDFNNIGDLRFSKPSSVAYFEDTVSVGNWTQAYIKAVAFLVDDYPETFKRLLNQNLMGQGRSDFADENGAKQMAAPKQVVDNLYIETNLSATDIVTKIRRILDACNVDYENLIIRYAKKDAPASVHEEKKPSTESESKTAKGADRSNERVKFIDWMRKAGISTTAILSYQLAIDKCEKALKSYGITEDELVTVEDVNTLVYYRDELFTKTAFRKQNEQQNNRFKAAFNKLIDYRSVGKKVKLTHASSVLKPVKTENTKIAIPDFASSVSAASDPESERFDAILRENFSEGLLPNALRLDKFRMLYEDEYGTEPTQDDDLLISKLKKAGSFIDGRIYPKKDAKQSNLLAEMLTEIINTLNNGAMCIYISCVMDRWQQELASQLSVYNEDTLRALLVSQKVPGLLVTDNVLKATAQKVHPEENIISVMKESHYGMTYQQLQEKIWFIPLDEIKHTLVTTPEIVNVERETYFYAPNFPASPTELQQLKMCMKSRLDVKGYLVAQDIYNIIHEQCRTIAINTPDYKDWAYRNVLKYLFRNDFNFSSSIVSEKGKALQMPQIFRDYCREHDQFSLREIKDFADELGVSVYWEDVRPETVRISIDKFVRRDLVHFEIAEIDRVLNEFCPGDYIALHDISLFLHFPATGYPWNEYVLESYLLSSKMFRLYHSGYAASGVYGIMVRADSRFADYRAVVVDMLAHNNTWKTSEQALKLIVDKKYQARKAWANFEQVAQEAGLLREKIETERK